MPLAAYEQQATTTTSSNDPATYFDNRKSLPSSIQEKRFIAFVHKVGVDYHRYRAVRGCPKNNGHRPLPLADLETRIQQRAMTLVGGGIDWSATKITTNNGSSSKKKNTKAKGTHDQTRSVQSLTATAAIDEKDNNNRMKPLSKKKRIRSLTSLDTTAMSNPDETIQKRMTEFLQELNGMWNDYMYQLLQLDSESIKRLSQQQQQQDDVVDTPSWLWTRVTSYITKKSAQQFIGAQVRIKQCRHCPSWTNRVGIFVGSTSQTWHIMIKVSQQQWNKKRKRHPKNTTKHNILQKNNNRDESKEQTSSPPPPPSSPLPQPSLPTQQKHRGWKSIMVPKRGSTLSLLISLNGNPLNGQQESENDSVAHRASLLFFMDNTTVINEDNTKKSSFLVIDLEEDAIP